MTTNGEETRSKLSFEESEKKRKKKKKKSIGDVSNSPGEIPTSKRIPCTCVSHLSREITDKRTVVK
jgi:hypothetical protein